MANSEKIPIDLLEASLKRILRQYGDEISEGTATAVKAVARNGARAVNRNAAGTFGGTGEYAKSWTYQVEESRNKSTATIHSKKPGLPHLLENGHAKRGGGRVMGRVHIAPVEAEVEKTLTTAITKAAQK